MALRLEDFAAFRANWEDKAANLRVIAQELSLGLDSFVFFDDNPLEREWVRSQLPEVAVVELGALPFHFVRQLDSGRHFEALKLSGEDIARSDQYRAKAQREELGASSASLTDFLQNLQLEAAVEDITDKNLARVTQLLNKTNQFNVTTRRYTEAQVCAVTKDPQAWGAAFRMSDRMGSYGLIGVLLCRPADCGSALGNRYLADELPRPRQADGKIHVRSLDRSRNRAAHQASRGSIRTDGEKWLGQGVVRPDGIPARW